MPDESYLDECYFVDGVCLQLSVLQPSSRSVHRHNQSLSFDWAENKPCYVYCVRCHSCANKSMHLSFTQVELTWSRTSDGTKNCRFDLDSAQRPDDLFFYSVPTSFFVLDNRIPRILRELFTEAEGSLKSNYLTGASACARKIVYELTRLEGSKYPPAKPGALIL